MLVIREFESMHGSLKATGTSRDVKFAYRFPAHLSIGQEGATLTPGTTSSAAIAATANASPRGCRPSPSSTRQLTPR